MSSVNLERWFREKPLSYWTERRFRWHNPGTLARKNTVKKHVPKISEFMLTYCCDRGF